MVFHSYQQVITNSGSDVDSSGFCWDNGIDLTSWLFLSVNKRMDICYREGNLYNFKRFIWTWINQYKSNNMWSRPMYDSKLMWGEQRLIDILPFRNFRCIVSACDDWYMSSCICMFPGNCENIFKSFINGTWRTYGLKYINLSCKVSGYMYLNLS